MLDKNYSSLDEYEESEVQLLYPQTVHLRSGGTGFVSRRCKPRQILINVDVLVSDTNAD